MNPDERMLWIAGVVVAAVMVAWLVIFAGMLISDHTSAPGASVAPAATPSRGASSTGFTPPDFGDAAVFSGGWCPGPPEKPTRAKRVMGVIMRGTDHVSIAPI